MGSMYSPSARLISIHALREEGDAIPPQATGGILIFQSTPSARRATTYKELGISSSAVFQSTPSARRATVAVLDAVVHLVISIHALREEGDLLT